MRLRAVAALALGMLLVCLTLGASPAHAASEDFVEACSNGIAVPDPEDNAGLVQDCATLLSIRDTLGGELDWHADTPIQEWYGVTITSAGVTYLELLGDVLAGTIPPELGALAALERLVLDGNGLTGPIPPDLGRLGQLRVLWLMANFLTGSIPP